VSTLPVESDLIRYAVWRLSDYDGSPTVTRIIKIVYLVDLLYSRERRRHEMGFSWRYYHYGPYASEVQYELDELTQAGFLRAWSGNQGSERPRMYRPVLGEPSLAGLPYRLIGLTDEICSQWGRAELNDLLSYVYFQTPPMRHALRGQPLDLLADLNERWPAFYRPLPEPDISASLRGRLASWRTAHNAHLPRVRLDPEPRFDDEYHIVEEDQQENVPPIRGTFHVGEEFDPDIGW